MSLQHFLTCVSTEQLIRLHGDLVDASIAFETKGNWRDIFSRRRKESKGKLKIIYANLKTAKKDDINAMIGVLVELLPNGVNDLVLD